MDGPLDSISPLNKKEAFLLPALGRSIMVKEVLVLLALVRGSRLCTFHLKLQGRVNTKLD